jgi:hypothetical protein
MNGLLIASGLVAAFMLVGHGTIGRKQFFLPMLGADFDPVAKRTMEFVWHMSTAALVLPPVVLLYAGIKGVGVEAVTIVVAYLALQYLTWGVVHFAVTTTSGLPGAMYKMFQWMLFLAVGGLAMAGVAVV